MPEISPQLRRGLVALAAVLLFAGAVGAAMLANNDDKPDIVAGPGASTTLVDGVDTTSVLTPDGSSATTVAPSGRGTVTTSKPKTPVTTAAPPATAPASADPGPAKPTPLGQYRYAMTYTDSEGTKKGEQVVNVESGPSGGGVTRRVVTRPVEGRTTKSTDAWSSDSLKQERVEITIGAQSIECDWQPDVLLAPLPLSTGAVWTADSSCTVANGAKLELHHDSKVTGRAATTVGGQQVNVWVIETKLRLKIATPFGNETEESDVITHFDPTRGIDVFESAKNRSSSRGESTLDRRLLNLNPT
ncbi:MAG TPA: hypothetical protein VNB24_02185 [Acidimicrobiales bacterium]|nr:hypothetical protein [Acidimicrobiales bacterium]